MAKKSKQRENGSVAINMFDLFGDDIKEFISTPKKTTIKDNVIDIKKNKEKEIEFIKTVENLNKEKETIRAIKSSDKIKSITDKNLKESTTKCFNDVKDLLLQRESIPGDLKGRYEANVAVLELLRSKNKDILNSDESKRTLSKYSGWGGHSTKFNDGSKSNDKLKGLMDDEEYKSALESTLTSFYTPLYMIKFIYSMLKYMGFENGKILDPSTGTGRFLGAMNEEMYYTSKITAIEPDKISHKISSILYNESEVINSKFEDVSIRDDSFDLGISNIPFGSFRIYDKLEKDLNENNYKIHDYFFAKTIKKVRLGGIIAFITSTATLDSNSGKRIREEINKKCDFLCAIRFPKNTFVDTEVGCDVVFLQKTNKFNKRDKFLEVTEKDGIKMNEYFHKHKQMVIQDEMIMESFAGRPNLIMKAIVKKELNLEGLKKRIKFGYLKNLGLQDIYEGQIDDSYMYEEDELIQYTDDDIKHDEIVLFENKLYQRQGNNLIPVNYKGKKYHIFTSYLKIKEALKDVINIQLNNYTENKLKDRLEHLNKVYDAFIDKFGYINSKANKTILNKDIWYHNVSSLEEFNYASKTYTKTDIFFKQSIVTHSKKELSEPHEAFKLCLCHKGKYDIDYVCDILKDTDYDKESIISDLCSRDLIAYIPYKDKYIEYNSLISGNTKEKLALHEVEYKKLLNSSGPKNDNEEFLVNHYIKNIEILKDNQPEYIEDVFFSFASSWIPLNVKKKFISKILKIDEDEIELTYNSVLGHHLKINTWLYKAVEDEYGTGRRNPQAILLDTLNMKDITVVDEWEDSDGKNHRTKNLKETQEARNMQEKVRLDFDSYINDNIEFREFLIEEYNDKFNNFVEKNYQNILYDLDINPNIKLREHQLKGASRIITSEYNTLLAHSVGSGKTFTMIAASQELININTHNNLPTKNLIVIPNSLCESGQFARDYLTLYPQANILATTSKDLSSQNRRRFLAKAMANNYDAIIIAHSALLQIPIKRETEERFIEEDLEEMKSLLNFYKKEGNSSSVKKMQSAIKNYEKRLGELNDIKRDNALYDWEDLGFTSIFIDEAHNFKNLDFPTKLQVAGLSNTNAKKSKDLYIKIRSMKQNINHSKVVFASATPVSNSLSELYTLQRYLMPEELKLLGVNNFDAWASTFAQVFASMEIDSTGTGCKSRQRIHLHNIPELINIFKKSADIVNIENIEDIKLPKSKLNIVELEPTVAMEEYILDLLERSQAIENGGVDPEVDNMLKIVNEGKLLVISPRLVGIDEDSVKINAVVENLTRMYFEKDNTTHLVFCDYGTPGSKSYNVYKEIKDKLLENNIKEEHVAFIHDADTPEKRREMIKQVNDCNIRILIGSSPRLAEGVNCQEHLYSVHHLSVPWRPSDIEQRNGRMVRQHNKNESVEEFRYVVKNSFDAFSWQLIEQKEKDIMHILKGDKSLRSLEDISDHLFTFAETKACACGDTRILDLNKIDQEIRKLQYNEKIYMDRKTKTYREIKNLGNRLQYLQSKLPLFKDDILTMIEAVKNKNIITLDGYEDTDDMEKIEENFKEIINSEIPGKLGTIYGLDIYLDKYERKIFLGKSRLFTIQYYKWFRVMLKNLYDSKNVCKNSYNNYLEEYNNKLKDFKLLKESSKQPFKDKEKLEELYLKKKDLETQLLIDTNINDEFKNGKKVV